MKADTIVTLKELGIQENEWISMSDSDKVEAIQLYIKKNKSLMLNLLAQTESELTFTCQACKHELPLDFSMRTEGFCYLCDPNITVDELLSDEELLPCKH